MWYMEFLGGLVVRACCGLGPIPGLGTETPHQAGACRSCKKEKKKRYMEFPGGARGQGSGTVTAVALVTAVMQG